MASNMNSDGFNQYHVSALYDILDKSYVDAIIKGIKIRDEPRAAIDMIEAHSFEQNSILICDRGYAALNLMEHCNHKEGLDCLIRVKESWISEVKRLPMEECDRDIPLEIRTTQTNEDKIAYKNGTAKYASGKSKTGQYKASQTWGFGSPHRMDIRVVRFRIAEEKFETIATSLSRDEFPAGRIKELYKLRWGIETSFRDLKYSIGMVNFHARKDDGIVQEIFASLVMYNFCARVTACVVVVCATPRVYAYQVNFTVSAYLCRKSFRKERLAFSALLQRITRYVEPVREGRADKRKMKNQTVVNFIYRVA